jgi:tetratricopeptide (TPR) repeat protein
MRLRQEPLVFLLAALGLGLMSWRLFTDGAAGLRGLGRAAEREEPQSYAAPDTAGALPDPTFQPPLARAVFAPPSDTAPLPPLTLVEPPRARMPALLPPTEPGPAPRAYGKLLRRPLAPVELPELFAEEEPAVGDELPGQEPPSTPGRALVPGREDADDDPFAGESAEQRAARIQGYKRRYDWVARGPGELWFGRIENEDRYGLEIETARASEPLLFVRLDPESGREFYGTIQAPPIAVERSAISSFGFADTIANGIELRARRIGSELTRGSFDQALQLAGYCVSRRLEAPRALALAEDLFRRCAAFDPQDPLPRLGLARCLEAAFRFEEAFGEYQDLLRTFAHRQEVHVRLAELEERFLLFEQAESRLRAALAMDQGSWVGRSGLGRFLAHRGRHAEALEHLRKADAAAPQDPDLLRVRVALRTDLADALLALGELSEAQAKYRSALAADPTHQRARAGLLATEIYGSSAGGSEVPAGLEGGGDGSELVLARGIAALVRGEHEAARDLLLVAAAGDPLRQHLAYAALSFLAELTGDLEQALVFAGQALERDPTYAYALYQRGRLLGLQDDYEGARAALLAALEQELDFEDALVSLGEMAFRLGRFEDAERYLERAVALEDGRAEVHALRGLNALRLSAVPAARVSFERALELAPFDPTASAGLAWCLYLEGEAEEALIQIANIDERRRSEPEQDPWRVWSRAQIARLQDHLQKEEWRDGFERKRLGNGWTPRGEDHGPVVALVDGAVELAGLFAKSGEVLVQRELPAGRFVSFEADVWVEPGKDNVRVGLFLRRERPTRDRSEVIAEASVARHKEGGVQVRLVSSGQPVKTIDMQQAFPTGRWVRVKLERVGESSESLLTLFLDGIPLLEGLKLPALGQTTTPVLFGLLVEGETGREALARLDNVSVVQRR